MFTIVKIFMAIIVICLHKIAVCAIVSGVKRQLDRHITTVQFVKGGVANIPCNISLLPVRDQVQAVIWYKENTRRNSTPLYTFDVRDKALEEGEHWTDEKILGTRATFRYQDKPAKLVILNLKESDAGIYNCRVDFTKDPTLNYQINVTVTVPPEKIILLDEVGEYVDKYVLGPYSEGDSFNITCIAIGGRPQPNVTWWKETTIVDNVSEIATRKRVKNTLHLHNLTREDAHSTYTCQVSNNNNVPPLTSSVTTDMYFQPLRAKLWGKQHILSAGSTYEISCEIIGSRPRPIISWWLDNIQLTSGKELSNSVNYTSTSFLTFKPSMDQHKKIITCKGTHPIFVNSTVEDIWKLNIYFKPFSTLTFDSAIDRNDIREGMDVMLHCSIRANPSVYTINWIYNDEAVYNNLLENVIINNQTLLVKTVNRTKIGNFTCRGTNIEGTGESNPIQLNIKYPPQCRPGQTKIYRTVLHNRAEISCELEANPRDVEFTWRFKYNDGNIVNLLGNFIASEGTKSTIHYTPSNEDDFPTIICSGKNSIGETEDFCIFHLLPDYLPEAPSHCKVIKQTESSLHVECIDEFNRGIRGEFIMEVYDAQTGKLVRNVTSKDPTFVVGDLESGIGFDVDLYVLNKEGKGLVTHLPTFTLTKDYINGNLSVLPSTTTLLGMLIGVVGILIILAITIVLSIRNRPPKSQNVSEDNGFHDSSARYMSMRSNKFSIKTDSIDSCDSFDTEN
ncbi:hypothetical protein FQA39_LY10561 [Lamprigera yunnana]|nr:hypothetical protein FQA39_LY10561 [Lamprigera yunnana]